MVYTSASLALAALETLAHADRHRFKRDYVAFRLTVPDPLIVSLDDDDLPDDWQARVASQGARRLGDRWLDERGSVALDVPSVLVPVERNLLLDPHHQDFDHIVVDEPIPFRFDGRL